MPPKIGFYSSVDREAFYRPGHAPVHAVEYWTKGLRHSVWFSQAVSKSVENGHTTFMELSPNPAVLISVAAVTFAAGIHDAELIETLRRKEDESYGVINALMKLYVHGHAVDVGSLFGQGDFADVPRTRFERKPYWLDRVDLGWFRRRPDPRIARVHCPTAATCGRSRRPRPPI